MLRKLEHAVELVELANEIALFFSLSEWREV